MKVIHVEVVTVGERTSQGIPLTLSCGHGDLGNATMTFRPGDSMVCWKHDGSPACMAGVAGVPRSEPTCSYCGAAGVEPCTGKPARS